MNRATGVARSQQRLDDSFLAEDLQTLAKSALIPGALFCDRLVVPLEEAALGLEADAARVDVLLQHRRRAVGVGEIRPDDLGDRAGRVPAGMLLLHDRAGRSVAKTEG